jgi:hypothetical protein
MKSIASALLLLSSACWAQGPEGFCAPPLSGNSLESPAMLDKAARAFLIALTGDRLPSLNQVPLNQ